jgi:hypothetical protein
MIERAQQRQMVVGIDWTISFFFLVTVVVIIIKNVLLV